MTTTRRQFFKRGGALIAALSVYPAWRYFGGNRHAPHRLGSLYLEQVPAEGSRERLERVLFEGFPWRKATPGAIQAFIAARVRADFESEDVLIVENWLLTRTELRSAAYLSLANCEGWG